MNHRLHLAGWALAGATLAWAATAKAAEDRAAWFKSLKVPHSGHSCCDVSDCARTDAEWRNGRWWAVVEGTWMPVPHDKELDTTSIDREAYVCAGPGKWIYCFVRPTPGM